MEPVLQPLSPIDAAPPANLTSNSRPPPSASELGLPPTNSALPEQRGGPPHSSQDDDDDDDGSQSGSDGENGRDNSPHSHWYPIEEDKSAPCEDEVAFIKSRKEHSALDHAYWEKKAFFDLDDPELVPVESGRIDWLVSNFNGTKENPNNAHLMRSHTVAIGGYDWQIKFYPRGNRSDYLSVYVECVSMLSPDFAELEDFQNPPFPALDTAPKLLRRRSIAAQICVVMYNPAEPRTYEYRAEAHQFHKSSADYGWKYFTRYSRHEFHIRQHRQRQAILRDDKLAFLAYIRVVKDPTRCMWEHGTRSPDEMVSVTGLRPFQMSSHHMAAALPLLHLRPFRDFVCRMENKGETFEGWLRPLLLKLYTRKRSTDYDSVGKTTDGDVVEMLWRLSRDLDLDLDYDEQNEFRRLVGSFHAELGAACGTNRLNTKDFSSIQAAVKSHDNILERPMLLTLELQRQEHDKKTRKWVKLTNRVQVEDHIDVANLGYTLYAFITHCGPLHSSRYHTYIRPRGAGTAWYAYQDRRVTCLTAKQARDKLIRSDPKPKEPKPHEDRYDSALGELHESAPEVTCVVMYVRDDVAEPIFSFPSTETWRPTFPVDKAKEVAVDANNPPPATVHALALGDEGGGVGSKCQQDASEPIPAAVDASSSSSSSSSSAMSSSSSSFSPTLNASTPEPPQFDGDDVVMRDAEGDGVCLDIGEPSPPTLEVGTIDWLGRPYYQGQFNPDLLYHGGGHWIGCNGDEYLGSFVDGQRSGWGKMIYAATGDVYEGEWQHGRPHGQGKATEHSTGNVFEGGWRDGKRHGRFVLKGTVTDEDRSACTICYARDISTAFYDCGHVVACRDCAALVDTCPVCRKRVVARLQLYGVRMTWA